MEVLGESSAWPSFEESKVTIFGECGRGELTASVQGKDIAWQYEDGLALGDCLVPAWCP